MYNQVAKTGQQFLDSAEPGAEKEQLKKKIDDMMERWDTLKTKTAEDAAAIDETLPPAKKYREKTDEFLGWLAPTERKLENFEKLIGDRSSVARQQGVAKELSDDVLNHKPQFDELEDSEKRVTDVAKKDNHDVKKEFDEIAGRWEKLQIDLGERSTRLATVEKLLEEYNNKLGPVVKLIERGEETLKNASPLGIDVQKNKEQVKEIEVI